MATWKLDKSAIKIAIAREIQRQGIGADRASEVSPEQMQAIDYAADTISRAFATEFDRVQEGGEG